MCENMYLLFFHLYILTTLKEKKEQINKDSKRVWILRCINALTVTEMDKYTVVSPSAWRLFPTLIQAAKHKCWLTYLEFLHFEDFFFLPENSVQKH